MFSRRHPRAAHTRRAQSRKRSPHRRRKLGLEQLEERRVLAVMTVTSLTDDTLAALAGDSQLSLREAIEAINTAAPVDGIGPTSGVFGVDDEIVFDPALFAGGAQTIDLAALAGQLNITRSVTITGPSAGLLTIDAGDGADGNFATGDGVRIFNIDDGDAGTDSPVTISGLTLTGGDVAGLGGAIQSFESLTIAGSEIRANASTITGGGVHVSIGTGNVTISSSTIADNHTGVDGGGLLLQNVGGTALITNSTISNNTADDDGGGIFVNTGAGGTTTVRHSTITENESDANSGGAGTGGGIFATGAGTLELDHTIVAGNFDNTGTAPDIDLTTSAPGTINITFSLIGDNTGTGLTEAPVGAPDAAGNLIGDPGGAGVIDALLAPLGNYGGPTLTHALLAGSPAIDAGSAAFVPPPAADQRGLPFVRIAGAQIDIGAFERQAVAGLTLVVDTLVDENDGDYSPGDLSLREAIGLANGSTGPDTITFANALSGATFVLTLGQITIADALTIDASALAARIIIDASGNDATPGVADGQGTRVFDIDDGDDATDSPVTLIGITLQGGDVTGSGGAIRSRESLVLRNSVVRDNAATASGGGIAVLESAQNVEIVRTTIAGNTAGGAGGGIHLDDVDLLVEDSTLSGNTAGTDGGGIFSDTSLAGPITTRVRNSTLSGNTAARGGGLFNFDGLTVLEFSTITNNTAPAGEGSGVASWGDAFTRTEVYSTIIAGNANTDVDFVVALANSFVSGGFNLIGDGNAVGAFVAPGDVTGVADPLLLPLGDYGGPTQTHPPSAISPALDAGNPADFPGFGGVPVFDQRGNPFPRVLDGNGDLVPRIDIGAVEVENQFNGPQITGVFITGHPLFDLFVPKPTLGPTPLVQSITINVRDLPPRFAAMPTPALNQFIAQNPGLYTVVGDANGIIPIAQVIVTNNPVVLGEPATATIELVFVRPLPDDRFTLTISDALRDFEGNRLDGESNALQPLSPTFPSGDGIPSGNFVARFTVDSRPEIGVWGGGQVLLDTNGNFIFDPTNLDFTNRDLAHLFGFSTDVVFAGRFMQDPLGVSDGFHKLAAYGRVGNQWRWLIDLNNDGIPDATFNEASINGYPVAGNFDGNAANGDEVGIFTGSTWHLDTDHDFRVDTVVQANGYRGYPVVGDFNGDGLVDLATYDPTSGQNIFSIMLATGPGTWPTTPTYQFRVGVPGDFFGFGGVLERPVAADMNADGVDDLGLFVPSTIPGLPASWYFLLSDNNPATVAVENTIIDRIEAAPTVPGGTLRYVAFNIVPFGNDLFAQFGSPGMQPIVGNFDPPVVPGFAPLAATVPRPAAVAPAVVPVAFSAPVAAMATTGTSSMRPIKPFAQPTAEAAAAAEEAKAATGRVSPAAQAKAAESAKAESAKVPAASAPASRSVKTEAKVGVPVISTPTKTAAVTNTKPAQPVVSQPVLSAAAKADKVQPAIATPVISTVGIYPSAPSVLVDKKEAAHQAVTAPPAPAKKWADAAPVPTTKVLATAPPLPTAKAAAPAEPAVVHVEAAKPVVVEAQPMPPAPATPKVEVAAPLAAIKSSDVTIIAPAAVIAAPAKTIVVEAKPVVTASIAPQAQTATPPLTGKSTEVTTELVKVQVQQPVAATFTNVITPAAAGVATLSKPEPKVASTAATPAKKAVKSVSAAAVDKALESLKFTRATKIAAQPSLAALAAAIDNAAKTSAATGRRRGLSISPGEAAKARA